jgi:hypothetical protein
VGTTKRSICDNALRMVAKEHLPSLRGRRPPPRHILGHAGLADLDAELEKLSIDSWCPSQRVGDAHLADQPSNFQRYGRSTAAVPRLPAPIQSKTDTVPTDHGVRLYNRLRLDGIRRQFKPKASHARDSGAIDAWPKMPPPTMKLFGACSLKRNNSPGWSARNCVVPLGYQKLTSSCGADALNWSNQDLSVTATKRRTMINLAGPLWRWAERPLDFD